jgi:hypothetical protein
LDKFFEGSSESGIFRGERFEFVEEGINDEGLKK